MIDFFDRLYSINFNKKILIRAHFNGIVHIISKLIANFVLPIYFKLTKHKKCYSFRACSKNEGGIIVSFTTIPARINRIWIMIESILRQTQKPDRLILWLSNEQFPCIDVLPKILLDQTSRGLEIRFMSGDIRSHKKYYYALKEFCNYYLLTVDDDIIYRSTMISDMYNYSRHFPGSVISQYCMKMIWNEEEIESFSLWPIIVEETTPNLFSFFGSGGGTLFPPFSMDPDVLNEDLFMNLTPLADDVWLNAMCRLNMTNIVKTKYFSNFLPILYRHNSKLESVNCGMRQNDIQIQSLRGHYFLKRGVDPFCEYYR